jgi:hypothetical protein
VKVVPDVTVTWYTPFIEVPAVLVAPSIWMYAPVVTACEEAVVTVTVEATRTAVEIGAMSTQS